MNVFRKLEQLVLMAFFCISLFSYADFNKITILTGPSGNRYGGHYAVTRSLIEGLRELDISHNYNPRHVEDVGDVVVVLADIGALRRAIRWKREGIIKVLLAGPNLMVRADEYGGVIAFPEIDACIVPSDWVEIAYKEELPALSGRIRCWYTGVDVNDWRSKVKFEKKNTNKVLVYWKTEGEKFCAQVEDLLRKLCFEPVRIRYGSYDAQHYKLLVDKCLFSVFISISESQGIALAETWSMDIPTLVWNKKELIAHGRTYSVVSACPYLTDATGRDWKTLEDFEKLLISMDQLLPTFSPRKWVLENMTDKRSAEMLVDIINSLTSE